jgi:DNA repair protein RadC
VKKRSKVRVTQLEIEHSESCACETATNPFAAYEQDPFAAAQETSCAPVIRNGMVERTCKPSGVTLAGPRDVWKILKSRADRQGVEPFFALGASIQDEMVGEPVLVALGQTTGVRVDCTQVYVAMLGLCGAGATTLYAAHLHPSGTNHEPSDKDRDLTRRIKEGFDRVFPERKWGGHIVCSSSGFSVA